MKKQESTELQTTQAPGGLTVFSYGDDEDRGFENQTASDVSLPFMIQLQGLSPQIESMEEAKPGLWMNTVTEQLYTRDEGFLFVPATTRHLFAEWVPREQGGGFRGHHEPDSRVVQDALKRSTEFGKYGTPEGNQLTETFYVYGVVCDEESNDPVTMAVIAFWSTKIRAYKTWMTRNSQFRIESAREPGRKIRPPLYANLTRICSAKSKNNKGEFYIPKISPADSRGQRESLLAPDDPRFLLAKACLEAVDAGAAKVDFSKSTGGENPADDPGQTFY